MGEWQALLAENCQRHEKDLDLLLADRIRFTPDPERRRYMLTLPVTFDRVLTYAVGASVQVKVASLTGFEPVLPP